MMFADFLPPSVRQLQDSTCITLAQSLKRQSIAMPLSQQHNHSSPISFDVGFKADDKLFHE